MSLSASSSRFGKIGIRTAAPNRWFSNISVRSPWRSRIIRIRDCRSAWCTARTARFAFSPIRGMPAARICDVRSDAASIIADSGPANEVRPITRRPRGNERRNGRMITALLQASPGRNRLQLRRHLPARLPVPRQHLSPWQLRRHLPSPLPIPRQRLSQSPNETLPRRSWNGVGKGSYWTNSR